MMVTTNPVPVDASNSEQLAAWDGDEGAYWAANAAYFDRSVAEHHRRLLDAAAITAGERVLDIGCGTGQTTRDAARAASAGLALGVDLSSRMLDYARQRAAAEGVTNAQFLRADAQIHAFDRAAFDVAISRTGAMFFGNPRAAFANIGGALISGSRLTLMAWQPLGANEWIREIAGALAAGRDRPAPPPDAPGPFSLSDPERVGSVLSAAGFTGIDLEAVEADMWFGTDADDAQRFIVGLVGWMLEGLDEPGQRRALDDLRTTVAAHASAEGVVFGSAAWIIRGVRP
jgi:SAM-dependent methyltransferase